MQAVDRRTLDEADESKRQKIKDSAERLFLGELALMFGSLFLVMDAVWFHVVFRLVAVAFAIVVLRSAYQAAAVIPASIPFQRPLGVAFYLTGHAMWLFVPGELPLQLLAILMIIGPLAIIFLFE